MFDLDLSSVPTRRGVYTATRASQLSGVPKSTVYYWAREPQFLVVPSISAEKVKLWSYRDLVLLRFVAWLRSHGVSAPDVAAVMDRVGETPVNLSIRTGERRVFGPTKDPNAVADLLDNQLALAGEIVGLLPEFRLAASEVDRLGRRHLWGPDLIRPTPTTRIHPDVLAGEPYVDGSRIPTSALFALTERGLEAPRIAELYRLEIKQVREAIWLERSMEAGERLSEAA